MNYSDVGSLYLKKNYLPISSRPAIRYKSPINFWALAGVRFLFLSECSNDPNPALAPEYEVDSVAAEITVGVFTVEPPRVVGGAVMRVKELDD